MEMFGHFVIVMRLETTLPSLHILILRDGNGNSKEFNSFSQSQTKIPLKRFHLKKSLSKRLTVSWFWIKELLLMR